MNRCLVIVGVQEEKMELIDKRKAKEIMHYIHTASDQYESTIAVVRKAIHGSNNFKSQGGSVNAIVDDNEAMLEYAVDNVIVTSGYDMDCFALRNDLEYDIIGISTAASVLTIAMSLYSRGYKVRVLSKYTTDRKGPELEKAAIEIMNAYMPGVYV